MASGKGGAMDLFAGQQWTHRHSRFADTGRERMRQTERAALKRVYYHMQNGRRMRIADDVRGGVPGLADKLEGVGREV